MQVMAIELDDCPPEILASWRAYAGQLAAFDLEPEPEATFTIQLFSDATRVLEHYWERGEGAAKVRWGTKGAMQRCIRLNRKHMTDPGGYCAVRHRHVTGEWPTEHGKAGIPS